MASVDRNVTNAVDKTTGVLASTSPQNLFEAEIVFSADAFAAFAKTAVSGAQNLDAAYGRALNAGRGIVGEGGQTGPGVVGIAGDVIPAPTDAKDGPRTLARGPFPGRGVRAGVIGFGQGIDNPDNPKRQEPVPGNAFGVVGMSDRNVGVVGLSGAHAGVYGGSAVVGVVGDGRRGQTGVEGVGSQTGVYGHVDFKSPNADGAGVFGAASMNFNAAGKPDGTFTGRAGVFVGPVDVVSDLRVSGNLVVFGTKSAAARHADGTHRLLYCMESPEPQFECFGEATLVRGKADVRIDRNFIGVADTAHYHVFLTPYGDSLGLYVSVRGGTGFQVREQGGGKSSIAFSYRVVAKRQGTEVRPFAKVRSPIPTPLPAEVAAPEAGLVAPAGNRRRAAGAKKGRGG